MMFNKVVFIGNLTRDVELRYTPSGVAIATIGLASNRRYKKQDGSIAEETCFIDVKAFGRVAEVINQYSTKGHKVLVEGRLVYETWTDQNGNKKSRHIIAAENIKLMNSKSEADNAKDEDAKQDEQTVGEDKRFPISEIEEATLKAQAQKAQADMVVDNMEEIPF